MNLSDWLNRTSARACDLAKAAGTTEATISRLKNGNAVPSLDLARRIAEATGGAVTANDFISRNPTAGLHPFETAPPLSASVALRNTRILVIIGGGIAAYKSLDLIRRIKERGGQVRVIITPAGQKFVTPFSVSALAGETAYTELFDLKDEAEIGHIRLAREADLIVVAPATASLIAKMAHGLAGDLATAVLLATDAPVLLAPAMNPHMWRHAATRRNSAQLSKDGIGMIGPNEGEMAEGSEWGVGRMAEAAEIMEAIQTELALAQFHPLENTHVLVTSGPTHEPLDPIRYIANRSSGRQGHAIARAAARLGARVTLVSGPTDEPDPQGVEVVRVETADEMMAGVTAALPADIAVCAAAVADWRPHVAAPQKMKKSAGQEELTLKLERNPDILATLASPSPNRPRLVIGFAAETEHVYENAAQKRRAKGCDWILSNDVSSATGVMGGETNTVHLITGDGAQAWPVMSKRRLAQRLMAMAAEQLGRQTQAAE